MFLQSITCTQMSIIKIHLYLFIYGIHTSFPENLWKKIIWGHKWKFLQNAMTLKCVMTLKCCIIEDSSWNFLQCCLRIVRQWVKCILYICFGSVYSHLIFVHPGQALTVNDISFLDPSLRIRVDWRADFISIRIHPSPQPLYIRSCPWLGLLRLLQMLLVQIPTVLLCHYVYKQYLAFPFRIFLHQFGWVCS